MKKTKLMCLLITLCVGYFNYAQEELGSRIILSTEGMSNANYYVYTPPFKATKIYNSLNEVTNEYPEQLMSSILSASNQEWVNYNTLGGEENADIKKDSHFQKVNTLNKEKTFFELYSKLTFMSNGSEMAIIKFYLYEESKPKPIAGATVMQKVDGRWFKTQTPYTTPIAMAMMVFKADVMERFLLNQPVEAVEKEILLNAYGEGGLNFNELLKVQLNAEQKETLTNPLNW